MSKSLSKTRVSLHLLNGGYGNGDKEWLEEAARASRRIQSWIVPKNAAIGDEVVINVAGFGLFATAKVASSTKQRTDWPNRYGAALNAITLIKPAISLPLVQQLIPQLGWARYPRSIATPAPHLADLIRKLVANRKKQGTSSLDLSSLDLVGTEELRATALLSSRKALPPRERMALYRVRSKAIRLYALRRAEGFCEACGQPAPFLTALGLPYLEVHHPHRVADGGPDHPAKVIALCPNCHRRAEFGKDCKLFNESLKLIVAALEAVRQS